MEWQRDCVMGLSDFYGKLKGRGYEWEYDGTMVRVCDGVKGWEAEKVRDEFWVWFSSVWLREWWRDGWMEVNRVTKRLGDWETKWWLVAPLFRMLTGWWDDCATGRRGEGERVRGWEGEKVRKWEMSFEFGLAVFGWWSGGGRDGWVDGWREGWRLTEWRSAGVVEWWGGRETVWWDWVISMGNWKDKGTIARQGEEARVRGWEDGSPD